MIFKFFGGAQEVGRSSILMKDSSTIMFDCGIKLLDKPQYPVALPEIDALVLSHAHIDHSGAVPTIYNEMFVPAFGTRPTAELSELLLKDSLQIARKEHLQAHFHKRQIQTFLNRYVSVDYGRPFTFGNYTLTMYDAGHICGSAITLLERKDAAANKRIVYTGDYKMEPQMLHRGAKVIEGDVLITESTYALRDHPPRKDMVKQLIERTKAVLESGGNVLLPSFAVGRSQELLAILQTNGLIDYTYVDGMARKATNIVLKYRDFLDNYQTLKTAADGATFVESRMDRMEALGKPSIIVTTAGMLNGGPAMDYITKLRHNSEILLTGYQVEGTNGRLLLDRGIVKDEAREIKIHAKASHFDLSAHAGRDELYEYAKKSGAHTIICVHGDHDTSLAMAENLKLEGFNAHAPKIGETIKID